MAGKVTWRVNSEKRAEQGTLWNHISSGQEEEEEGRDQVNRAVLRGTREDIRAKA